MRRRGPRPAFAWGRLLPAAALAASACAVFASKAELRLVERLRAETDPLARMALLDDYDSRFGPRGRMGEQVDPLRPEVEDGLWRHAADGGLEEPAVRTYLEHYPEGRHAEEARRRLDQLRYFAEADAAREAERLRAEEEERRRVEALNEQERARVRGGLERWLRTALALPRWGTTVEALASLDEGFREQWSGEPAPLCVAGTCRRTLTASYFFTRTGQTRVDRSISLVLQVDSRGGRVFQLVGYYTGRGFVDWLEMSSEQIIDEVTAEEREAAEDAMMAMTRGAIEAMAPGAAEVETDEEGVLLRFRRGELEVTLLHFPPTYAAGRVDGFQVTYGGPLDVPATPRADE